MSFEIIEKLKKEISQYKDDTAFEHVGVVTEVGDGIAKISGLSKALSQEILNIESSGEMVASIAFNLEESFIGAIILGDAQKVRVGDRVHQTGKVVSIKVGEELLGRVVDPLGNQLDNKGVVFIDKSKGKDYPLERSAPSVVTRESVNTPLHTGIKAIDAMIPIGRGQRELIIGDRQTGKTAIVMDTILNQLQDTRNKRQVFCVYVAVGQKNSKVAKIVKTLEEKGALEYTVIVSAPASSPASVQYLAPFAGCAIGEYFMDKGQDALVIYDDLSKHADAYRQLSLLLRRPPGREAYPGDIFYLHARLLERAAKLNKELGGGSLTALPIIETQLGDVSAYIPTNVISITDGQIYLESDLFYKGLRPAVNAGLSVSRVGSSAQTKAMKKVAGKLRLELAQFRELQAFVQFASDLDENTKKQIARGQRLTEILKQVDGEPISFEKQVIAIYMATNGYLDAVEVKNIRDFEKKMLDNLEKLHGDILKKIRETGVMDEETEGKLKSSLEEVRGV
ncbi:MAG: F0F1 ATP synthase subunit alpha [Candidatus Yanofskybacteria bacterium RIFCSPHIGHO2_02_FULL_41_29]|uniref:ATP synthase subunit alpha n=1 Tax=Candidatus Yanofskybacteria bacterium RIFCSPHIGHO2_01_FULL_41_53 TaxID=1802663 RepID=A0A1F8EHT8_9BACT|nr:MAG: F0F1 ATP synthase subunit alpha [Candidatus Yanofskybacteria bacterium RIFCSPHIGHO2_01_FULL_41_53]OGN11724.1 MAG: F0F1 ATP synthase subunit alpha [Candidatus Yanofskybacteria bacterium RIFCSPHIGHO2_02_FULL_41_29]OGN17489.1 MAG: F0F1 ATP synthase subunit alpha [Candidatus Yanofskybacteria bacterium RIFCSPHIGHO2_12_FULL_41_9]OGN22878.1 MAG: F0F1 ATP synthase subunit alpha [Candidatus Yanofskybacteria bacterium RIFCSPLOWO2_01_FULL_41_67]OGN28716.1 MAG: F0F1 ATP synthase subunit alpha [Cand